MELIILIGLQASGKSTFYRNCFAETHTLVSRDLMPNHRKPAQRQLQLVQEALQAGQSIVVDNTNATVASRADLIKLGKLYQAHVVGYYFAVNVARSQEWNRQRTGKKRIPEIGLFATLKKLVRPDYKEGFERLYYVQAREDFTFDIQAWIEEIVPDGC